MSMAHTQAFIKHATPPEAVAAPVLFQLLQYSLLQLDVIFEFVYIACPLDFEFFDKDCVPPLCERCRMLSEACC